ncbi:MAG TPA: TFIIB-type zinc ribbon-containing protein [Nitrososphaerales archaeon]|nr:TFIIB-type zinc ribbon-containing protein [Nitrososphaerales archaeon]
MTTTSCPECGGELHYEPDTKKFACKKCGLYVTREQIDDIKDKLRPQKKKSREDEYLEWWQSSKKSPQKA